MTATLCDLTASPHFHMIRRPQVNCPRRGRPETKAEAELIAYWEASRAINRGSIFHIAFGWSVGVLWRLAGQAALPSIERAAGSTLKRHGYIQLRPGPDGGWAA